jgi:hypothetical protein
MLRYLVILAMFVSSLVANAQGPDGRDNRRFDPQKFERQLEHFVLKKMELTQTEASAFLPLFRQKRKAEVSIMDSGRKNRQKLPTSEKEWALALKTFDNNEVKLKKIQQVYHEKMLKVIPASKVMRMIKAEEDFHRDVFRKVQMHTAQHRR